MRRLLLRCWLVLLLVTLSACGPYSGAPGAPPTPELRDQTIHETMSYLQAKDATGLKSMFAADFKNRDQAVDDWLRRWGGVNAADYKVSYKSPGGTTFFDTTIQTKSADGAPVTIPIWLNWSNDRWNIGYYPQQLSPTATPSK